MNEIPFPKKVRIHAVWLSDIHLGYKDCKADYLLNFLDTIDTEYLYLVGDIIDIWSMKQNFHWPPSHNQVVRKLIKMARNGVKMVYIPGNHDRVFRDYCNEAFGAIEIREQAVHTTQLGKRILMIHGDEFDDVIRFSGFIKFIGDIAYDLLLFINRWNNRLRNQFGYSYWSLAAYLKERVSKAAQAIHIFEQAALNKAKTEGYDGIVCGHIHHPNFIEKDGIVYCNDGDWIESCTALVEKNDGVLEIWHWSDRSHCMKRLNGEIVEHAVEQLDWLDTA